MRNNPCHISSWCSVTTILSGMVTLHDLPENEITLCEKLLQNKVIKSWNLANVIQSPFSKRHTVLTCLLRVWNLRSQLVEDTLSEVTSASWMSGVLLWVCAFREVPEEPSKGIMTVIIPASESPWWGAALRTKGGVTAAFGGVWAWRCACCPVCWGGCHPTLNPKARI